MMQTCASMNVEDLILYVKGESKVLDLDFKKKKKYGNVYYFKDYLYKKKGLKWYYYPLSKVKDIEIIGGSRQLRQCCGAPIYKTKSLLLTTDHSTQVYFDVEDINNGDKKHTERLLITINAKDKSIIKDL